MARGAGIKGMLEAGAEAPEFRLVDLRGNRVALNDLVGSGPALLVFFKISCPVCQYALPFLERAAGSERVRIYGISQDDAESTAEFNKEFGITFPVLLDGE